MSRCAVLAWSFAALLLVLHALQALVAERTAPTLLLTYAPQQPFALLAFGPLLFALLRRDRAAVLGALAGCALALALLGGALPSQTRAVGEAWGVMTYNVARGQRGPQELARVVRDEAPDVVCLQEVNGLRPDFLSRLARELPQFTLVADREVALLTRFPVRAGRVHELPDTQRRFLEARLDVRGTPVTVVNVHFTTVLLRGDIPGTAKRREAQARRLTDLARAAPGAFLACGDFNTPPKGRVYGQLRAVLSDAFVQVGSGFGWTFPARMPLLRLDQVWLSPDLRAVRAQVPSALASDHRPLVVDVAFPAVR